MILVAPSPSSPSFGSLQDACLRLYFLTAALAVAGEPSPVKISHVRETLGILGPTRTDKTFLPGDSFVLAYDIEGLTADDGGKVLYATTVEVHNDQGKLIYEGQPQKLEAVNALGGGNLPAYVRLDIGVNQPPGDYELKVTVSDRVSKGTASLVRKVHVAPPGFGLVRLNASSDVEGRSPAAVMAAGESPG